MSVRTRVLIGAGILIAFTPSVLFRAPANTVRSGDELAALAWTLAAYRGEGCWQLYPMSITVEIGELVTKAMVENCGITSPPGPRLPDSIPRPLDYVQRDNNVSIVFSEVP